MVDPNIQAEAERRRAHVVALRQSGLTLREIGERLGISGGRVGQILAAAARQQERAPPPAPPEITPALQVEELPISLRARNVLVLDGYRTLDDLLRRDRQELMRELLRVPNCNRHTWEEIDAVLSVVAPVTP